MANTNVCRRLSNSKCHRFCFAISLHVFWREQKLVATPSARKILQLGTAVAKYVYGRCPDTTRATLAFHIGLAFHVQALAPFSRSPLGFYTSRICPIPIGVPQGMCDQTPCEKIITIVKSLPLLNHHRPTSTKNTQSIINVFCIKSCTGKFPFYPGWTHLNDT